ncbi:MAG TPA: BatA and WFA domain-containing protein [Thermoguttaceae bacterium]|nr:BatA and WFA domain-containing protein [Thermoguttaceae bacterium]
MTFLAPYFLIAALAGAIPVVLHMIHRRRAKEIAFPTLRFLRASVEKTRRRRRIQDLLLMAIRVAALALVAVGLARPTIVGLSRLWGGGRAAAVVVLDNSASMASIDPDRPRLEAARDAVRQILDQLGESDQVALLSTNGPTPSEPPRLERTQEQIRQRLTACRASHEPADLPAKIDQARELLAQSDAANKQIWVITDMQARSWESDVGRVVTRQSNPSDDTGDSPRRVTTRPTDSDIPLILVNCHRRPTPNVAVADVRLDALLPIVGLPFRATVELENTSSIAQQRHVELIVDGVRQAVSPAIELPPGGRARHEFVFTFRDGGLHRGEARLTGRDGSSLDDRCWFAAAIDPSVPVAIVRGRKHEIAYLDDAFYLEQALAPGELAGSALRVTRLDAAELPGESLSAYRIVFCVNLPAQDEATAARLREYVAGGGTLVWIVGDRVESEAYNRMNAAAGGSLLPGKLLDVRAAAEEPGRDSWNVTFLDNTHPALGDLAASAALYESVLVYRHARLDTRDAPGAWILARLDDGECLLAQRDVGRGRVVLLGTSCQVDWTNLPLRPIFLPMLLRLTYAWSGTQQDVREAFCGEPLAIDPPTVGRVATRQSNIDAPTADDTSDVTGVEIEHPSGERVRLNIAGSRPGLREVEPQQSQYLDIHDPGVYVIRPLPSTPHPSSPASRLPTSVAVNLDPSEINSRTIAPDQLAARLGDVPLVVADHPDNLADVFQKLREGRSLRDIFLSAVLLLLVVETFLANRFVSKQQGS